MSTRPKKGNPGEITSQVLKNFGDAIEVLIDEMKREHVVDERFEKCKEPLARALRKNCNKLLSLEQTRVKGLTKEQLQKLDQKLDDHAALDILDTVLNLKEKSQ